MCFQTGLLQSYNVLLLRFGYSLQVQQRYDSRAYQALSYCEAFFVACNHVDRMWVKFWVGSPKRGRARARARSLAQRAICCASVAFNLAASQLLNVLKIGIKKMELCKSYICRVTALFIPLQIGPVGNLYWDDRLRQQANSKMTRNDWCMPAWQEYSVDIQNSGANTRSQIFPFVDWFIAQFGAVQKNQCHHLYGLAM